MRTETLMVMATTEVVGMHCWPGAPAGRFYLTTLHRHKFIVKVGAEVTHADRMVEFHDLADEARDAMRMAGTVDESVGEYGLINFGSQSCEMLAQLVLDRLDDTFDLERFRWCEVWEDGEAGARVERTGS
jgi:hypothetical protein